MLSDSCWKTRTVSALESPGGVGYLSSEQLLLEHFHKLNVSLSDYMCSTSF